jgi:hypothetical protein
MKLNMRQVTAAARHVLSFTMGAIAIGSVVHIIDTNQVADITGAVNQIATGLESVAAGVATLVTIGTAMYSAYLKSNQQLITATAAIPSVASVVLTTPAEANAIPSLKVVSQ